MKSFPQTRNSRHRALWLLVYLTIWRVVRHVREGSGASFAPLRRHDAGGSTFRAGVGARFRPRLCENPDAAFFPRTISRCTSPDSV